MTAIEPNEEAQGPGSQEGAEQPGELQGGASGFGAASAFARMKSQREHQARQRPVEDGGPPADKPGQAR